MFGNITAQIADKLIELDTIKEEDREIYEFGIQHIFITILNVATVMAIGALLNSFKESIIFFAAFIPLRIFAGGFHLKTPLRCYVFSSAASAAVILAVRFVNLPILIYGCLYAAASAVILIFSLVEDANKPLDDVEKIVYKRRTVVVWAFQSIIMLLMHITGIVFVSKTIAWSVSFLSLMIVSGVISNCFKKQK